MRAATWNKFRGLVGGMTFLGMTILSGIAAGADFYIDPERGSGDGDGSAAHPWASLQAVLDDELVESREPAERPYDGSGALVAKNPGAPVRGGDTLWLESGDYGALTIEGFYNDEQIAIRVAEGAEARFSGVLVRGSAKWRLEGLTVRAEYAASYASHTLVDLDSHAHMGPVYEIEVVNCELASVLDAAGWSAAQWDTLSCNGIQVDGRDHIIRGNHLKNVNFGISVIASTTLVERNVVDGFAGDGLRGLGDNSVFQYNTVKNCYDVNDNHDDGFQSWSVGDDGVGTGEVVGIVLRGNVFINYEDPDQPHRGTLQGIGCFDGTFVDWVVENNVVITDHWHGITLLGARGCRIVNNTVMDLNDTDPGPPWIRIDAHKDGTAPEDCLVRNNLTTALALHENVTEDHNLIIDDPAALFVDPDGFDLRLLETAEAVDTGASDLAPELDADGIPRPQGDGVDIGAYEWHEPGVEPGWDLDAGVPTDTGGTDGDAGTDRDSGAAGGKTGGGGCGCGVIGASNGEGKGDLSSLIMSLVAKLF